MQIISNHKSLIRAALLFAVLVPFFGVFMGIASFVADHTREACAIVTH